MSLVNVSYPCRAMFTIIKVILVKNFPLADIVSGVKGV